MRRALRNSNNKAWRFCSNIRMQVQYFFTSNIDVSGDLKSLYMKLQALTDLLVAKIVLEMLLSESSSKVIKDLTFNSSGASVHIMYHKI